jgi:hypothetical protein
MQWCAPKPNDIGWRRGGRVWVLVFAIGCAATALYGALTGAWLFVVLEVIWAGVALRRFTGRM